MRRFPTVLAVICLSVPRASEGATQELEAQFGPVDSLPDDFPPEALGQLEAVKSMVAGHRKNVPALLRSLKSSDSWKIRLAAGYALKEMGFQSLLVAAVDDSNPLVRTFARVVLVRPPVWPSAQTPENTKDYAVDDTSRDRAAQLARSPAALDPREKQQQLEAVVADLLAPGLVDPALPYGSDSRYVATKLALQDPSGTCAAVLRSVAGKDDPLMKIEALEALRTLATSPSRDAIYELSKDFLAAALADKDARVRQFGLSSLAGLGPLDLRFDAVLRLTKDADESVRDAAAMNALELIRDFEAAGNPKKADELFDQMARFSASKESLPDFDQTLAKTKARLDHERELLYKGETVATNKGVQIDRYLRVDGQMVDVTPEEYDAAVVHYGKPYVTGKQFRELRAKDIERLRKRNEDQGRSQSTVEYGPTGQMASPSGKAPEDRSVPAEASPERTPPQSPTAYRNAASLAILAAVAWMVFRVLRRKP